jgi:hypothetical protein
MKKIQEAPIPDFDTSGDFKQWKDLPGEDLSTYHHRGLKKMMAKSEPALKARLKSEITKLQDRLGISASMLNGVNGKITVNDDGSISVEGSVNWMHKNIKGRLPVRFREVTGDFYCNGNQLTNLTGAPTTVGGSFYCNYNQLTSLAGAPTRVGGAFNCHYNQLTSLTGAPTSIGGNFDCDGNPVPKEELLAGWHATNASRSVVDESMKLVNSLIG